MSPSLAGVASAKFAVMHLSKLAAPVLLLLVLSASITGFPASAAELPHQCEAHLCGGEATLEGAAPGSKGRPPLCLHEEACAGAAAHGFSSLGLAVAVVGVGVPGTAPAARRWQRKHGTLRLRLFVSQLFRPPRFA